MTQEPPAIATYRGVMYHDPPHESGCAACGHVATAFRWRLIADLYNEGYPVREIADAIGSTRGAVQITLRDLRSANRVGSRR